MNKRFVQACAVMILMLETSSALDINLTNQEGMAGTVRFSDAQVSDILAMPFIYGINKMLKIETGYINHYDFKYFDQVYFGVSYQTRKKLIALSLVQFGKPDFYSEQSFRLITAYKLLNGTLSAFWSGTKVGYGNKYESLYELSAGVGGAYQWDKLYGGFVVDNIVWDELTDNSQSCMNYSLYTEFVADKNIILNSRALFEKYSRPIFSISQTIKTGGQGELFWSLMSSPLKIGGGVKIVLNNKSITNSVSYYPILGFSYHISFAYNTSLKR